jgi:hypothetical protein
MLAVVCPPGDQLYVGAPDALRVTLLPLHIVEERLVVMVTVGLAFTVTIAVWVLVHPMALVPVTV